jgi:hypothetical protein
MSWLTASVLGITSLDGDLFAAKFNRIWLNIQRTRFLKDP